MKRSPAKLVCLLIAIVCLCGLAVAESDEDSSSDNGLEWFEAEEYTLYWGDEVNSNGYLISAVDFSPSKPFDTDNDYVILSILTNRSESWSTILALNNSEISDYKNFEDRINISTVELVTGNNIPAPYVIISVSISKEDVNTPSIVTWIDATLSIEEKRSNEIYMDERAHFEIAIKNKGNVPLESIGIIRKIPDDFIFDPDVKINWNFSLEAYDQRTYKYSLKALKPGTYNFSGTQILVNSEGRTHSKTLNASELIVHGPFINVSKTLSTDTVPLGDVVNVNISLSNDGDRAAHVSFTDELPQGAVLLDGDMSLSRVLHPDDNLSLTYSMRMDKGGRIVVPSAKVRFIDSKEYEGLIYSSRHVLNVGDVSAVSEYDPDEDYRDYLNDIYGDSGESDGDDYENEYGLNDELALDVVLDEEKDHGIFQPVFNLIDYIKGFFSRD
jgi:uncharacterized repeat protein (TIGR01451 family)